ncbi:uncharacterized protein LOC114882158 [Osmia bicornis bicornis]|uniref:uncharacterized protein LOC114882158 n=1 Tax=Osmia bicornis bicornis TaxID=1437191 RepID=UPI0010F56266|nr:uncharacterized protein LOC114882158 [Osmia bicornis bicornis]
MKRLLSKLQDNAGQLSKEELDDLKQQADEALKAFGKEHAHFEVVWPSTMTDHPYFEQECFVQMQDAHSDAKSLIAKEKARIATQLLAQQADQSAKAPAQSKLPDIELPKFNGSYTDWPSFINLFGSVVMNRKDLDDVEKFYYLKRYLRGEPLNIVSNLSLTGASLNAAVSQLRTRNENKRRLIQLRSARVSASRPTGHGPRASKEPEPAHLDGSGD